MRLQPAFAALVLLASAPAHGLIVDGTDSTVTVDITHNDDLTPEQALQFLGNLEAYEDGGEVPEHSPIRFGLLVSLWQLADGLESGSALHGDGVAWNDGDGWVLQGTWEAEGQALGTFVIGQTWEPGVIVIATSSDVSTEGFTAVTFCDPFAEGGICYAALEREDSDQPTAAVRLIQQANDALERWEA